MDFIEKNVWIGRFFLCMFFGQLILAQADGSELVAYENCRLISNEWNDGDSFQVKMPDGEEVVIRLYGVDCVETSIGTKADLARVREQQRYFGISEISDDEQEALRIALEFGEQASAEVQAVLSKPFTVHTSFANARGQGSLGRVYGFVTTSEDKDLAGYLVSAGLARAHGVFRQTPDGKRHDDYREQLKDLEFQAAKFERGIWAKTDWNKLPEERKNLRKEDHDLALAIDSQKPEVKYPLDLNTASPDELMTIRGIGKVMAGRIVEARPFENLDDLLQVKGIGEITFERFQPFLTVLDSVEN